MLKQWSWTSPSFLSSSLNQEYQASGQIAGHIYQDKQKSHCVLQDFDPFGATALLPLIYYQNLQSRAMGIADHIFFALGQLVYCVYLIVFESVYASLGEVFPVHLSVNPSVICCSICCTHLESFYTQANTYFEGVQCRESSLECWNSFCQFGFTLIFLYRVIF